VKENIMKTRTCLLIIGFLGVLCISSKAEADVYKGVPKEAVVLPDDGSGVTRVGLFFDLSSLRSGENRRIAEAVLDWRVSGLGAEELPQFGAYQVTESWSRTSVNTGSLPTLASEMIADGQVSSLVLETSEGKFLRLDMTGIVRQWAAGTTTNYGLVLATSDLGAKALSPQLGKIQLTVRYGFSDN
jgi:hypothetical protein